MEREYKRLRIDVQDLIAQVVLISDNGMNTMDMELMEELSLAFAACEKSGDVRVIILRAEGRAFCGGGDIKYLSEGVKDPNFTIVDFVHGLGLLTMQMKKCPKPIIAAVHGAAAGSGCNLALACDMILADRTARFMEAFVNIGLAPDTCGAFWLPRLTGSARAFEIMATGRSVSADEAAQIGMINRVLETEEEMLSAVMRYALKFTKGPTLAYQGLKEMLYVSMCTSMEQFITCEGAAQKRCERSEDFREGIRAFLEKRKPAFTGR